ncbi:MAG TPA: hypothetical protein VG674_21730 [Amycolatopsis sp.]|nr:hypothetical protein [Amycolatopsis sp.]
MPRQWTPCNDAELTAGWRLWLELGSCSWPGPGWDGTPAEAVGGLARLAETCNQILDSYREGSGPRDAEIIGVVRSMFVAASWTFTLWSDDSAPLDAERASLLHSDLALFAEHAAAVRTLLAAGGGWSTLSV